MLKLVLDSMVRYYLISVNFVNSEIILQNSLVWFIGFYGISTFVGYLTPNPFLFR